jgi:hypothetical protein
LRPISRWGSNKPLQCALIQIVSIRARRKVLFPSRIRVAGAAFSRQCYDIRRRRIAVNC